MAKSKNRFQNPSQIQKDRGNQWFVHYMNYLTNMTYQLFEWENLPDTVDPAYLERKLHQFGSVGFYEHPELGFLALQGTISGTLNHYEQPTHYHVNTPTIQTTFPLYHYSAVKPDGAGVVIYNNDMHIPTMDTLAIFASDLTELKEIIAVNQNAQKTPFLITTTPETKLSVLNAYNQLESNASAIVADKHFDPDAFKVHTTSAPYVVDKLNTQKNAVWNEIMTFLGIKNANLEKKERMVSDEVQSNDEQIESSGNIMLKSRQEACKRINELYGLNISVKYRFDVIDELMTNIDEEEGEENEFVHNGTKNDN